MDSNPAILSRCFIYTYYLNYLRTPKIYSFTARFHGVVVHVVNHEHNWANGRQSTSVRHLNVNDQLAPLLSIQRLFGPHRGSPSPAVQSCANTTNGNP